MDVEAQIRLWVIKFCEMKPENGGMTVIVVYHQVNYLLLLSQAFLPQTKYMKIASLEV